MDFTNHLVYKFQVIFHTLCFVVVCEQKSCYFVNLVSWVHWQINFWQLKHLWSLNKSSVLTIFQQTEWESTAYFQHSYQQSSGLLSALQCLQNTATLQCHISWTRSIYVGISIDHVQCMKATEEIVIWLCFSPAEIRKVMSSEKGLWYLNPFIMCWTPLR